MISILRHMNARLKLSEKIGLLLVMMVLVATVNLAVIYSYHQESQKIGNSINIAGQQRMLSQRMVRLANEIAAERDSQRARDRLRVATDRYDRNLRVLSEGGELSDSDLNPGSTPTAARPSVSLRGEQLAPAPSTARTELAAQRHVWKEYEPQIRTILESEPGTPQFERSLEYVRTNSDRLLAVSDTTTAEFARIARKERAELRGMLFLLLGVDVGVAVVGVLLTKKLIGEPIASIASVGRRLAEGDPNDPPERTVSIDHTLAAEKQRSELAQLERAVTAVHQYLDTVSRQSDALANRDFDAAVFEESVPGTLGQSLEEMRIDLQTYLTELQATTEELRQKNERLDEYASIVSHDLRNPLNVAQAETTTLRDEYESERVDSVQTSLERMESIIEDILTLAREGHSTAAIEPIDLRDLFESCWGVVETDDITLEIQDSRTILGNRERLRHVFENLFRNAVEHGGSVGRVRVGTIDGDGIFVEDDGTGIPDAEQMSVFESGYSSARDGTGLGLTIVERIAEDHGWAVDVTDGDTGGARFEFTDVDFEGRT